MRYICSCFLSLKKKNLIDFPYFWNQIQILFFQVENPGQNKLLKNQMIYDIWMRHSTSSSTSTHVFLCGRQLPVFEYYITYELKSTQSHILTVEKGIKCESIHESRSPQSCRGAQSIQYVHMRHIQWSRLVSRSKNTVYLTNQDNQKLCKVILLRRPWLGINAHMVSFYGG